MIIKLDNMTSTQRNLLYMIFDEILEHEKVSDSATEIEEATERDVLEVESFIEIIKDNL